MLAEILKFMILLPFIRVALHVRGNAVGDYYSIINHVMVFVSA